jgi:hypothetical protein
MFIQEGSLYDRRGIGIDAAEYHDKVKDPASWYFAGCQMYNAAVILFDIWVDAINKPLPRTPISPTRDELTAIREQMIRCCNLLSPYFMLMGYAIENLSKGLEVMEKTKPGAPLAGRSNLTISDLGVGDHNTKGRLERLGIIPKPEEEEAVQIALDCVIWGGKYCVPMRPGEHKALEGMPAVIKERQKYADPLNAFFDRLYREFKERAFRYFEMILG